MPLHSELLPLLLQPHPFNGHFFRTTWVSRYQKGETSLDFYEASDWLDSIRVILTCEVLHRTIATFGMIDSDMSAAVVIGRHVSRHLSVLHRETEKRNQLSFVCIFL